MRGPIRAETGAKANSLAVFTQMVKTVERPGHPAADHGWHLMFRSEDLPQFQIKSAKYLSPNCSPNGNNATRDCGTTANAETIRGHGHRIIEPRGSYGFITRSVMATTSSTRPLFSSSLSRIGSAIISGTPSFCPGKLRADTASSNRRTGKGKYYVERESTTSHRAVW